MGPGRGPSRLALAAGLVRWVTLVTSPANPPIRSHSGTERRSAEKSRKSCWRRAGRGLLSVPARISGPARGRGRGMDSVTRGSGIALSVLIAVMASILLLVPGQPAGSWRGPGTPGRGIMSSAAATSTSRTLGPGWQPAAGSRPGCRATGPHSGRARAGLTRPVAQPGSCRPPGAHRPLYVSRRLSRYRRIRPDLP